MLILNDKTIAEALSFEEIMETVEEAMILYDTGNYTMPDRMHLDKEENTLLLMPCFAGDYFGTKLVSVFPENHKKGLPTIMGTMILNNAHSGKPLALLDASALTAMRTGAVGGTAIQYLAQADATTLGIIGTGVQGLHQAFFACTARNISNIFLLNRNAGRISGFKSIMKEKFPAVDIQISHSVEDLVKRSEIIITATNSNTPVLPDSAALLKGKTIIAIGSYKPNMRELPESLYPVLDNVFVDTLLSKKESGDLVFPLKKGIIKDSDVKTLGSRIVAEQVPPGGTNLFKSVGMALFDLITGKAIYERVEGLRTKSSL